MKTDIRKILEENEVACACCSINFIAQEAYSVAKERANKEQAESPDDILGLLKHCAEEVVEATEAYSKDVYEFGQELADVMMCCLIAGKSCHLDMQRELVNCLKKNIRRANETEEASESKKE